MDLCAPALCTGCEACANSCPQRCIHMEPDSEGFFRPHIQASLCTHCGACTKSCPVLHPPVSCPATSADTSAYGVWHSSEAVRMASTSGGAFTALCSWVFQRGGVVFGAAYDDLFRVIHVQAENPDMLNRLRTAKYAQSRILDTFQRAKHFLSEGRYVLFSGTPCQIAGLSSYLGRSYDTLLLVDVICHGVPSPAVWRNYIEYRSRNDAHGSPPVAVNLRSKQTGWPQYSVSFAYPDGIGYTAVNSADPFLRAFVGNLCLRPSCYDCKFKGIACSSDFTLGDYWGVWDQMPRLHDGKGTSLVLVHREKAAQIWSDVASMLKSEPVAPATALADNSSALSSPAVPPNRRIFMENYSQQDFSQLVDQLLPVPAPKKNSYRRLQNLLRRLWP